MPLSFVYICYHYGKRLGGALLTLPQCLDCGIVRGIASQEKTPQTLNCHSFPLLKEPTGSGYRIRLGYQIALVINQLNLGTAFWAGVWLSMEAAIQGIIIFRLALGAHLEVAHGSFGAVIGHILNYGKAWATIGAVGKGVAVAAIFRI